jgi:hypothetical protein
MAKGRDTRIARYPTGVTPHARDKGSLVLCEQKKRPLIGVYFFIYRWEWVQEPFHYLFHKSVPPVIIRYSTFVVTVFGGGILIWY